MQRVTCGRPPRRSISGFTLVELLVVIGIIALLISILLPALNKARQAANVAYCLSNEHQMGLSIMQYVADSRGWLPYGYATVHAGGGWWNGAWTWCDTLTLEGNGNLTQDKNQNGLYGQYSWLGATDSNMAYDFSGIFHDKDQNTSGWANLASDYECNPRIIPDVRYYDGYANAVQSTGGPFFLNHRKIAGFRNSQSTMMVWCAGVGVGSDGLDHGSAIVGCQVDDGNVSTPIGLCSPPEPNGSYAYYTAAVGSRIALGTGNSPAGCSYGGSPTVGDTLPSLRRENVDWSTSAGYDNAAEMRFRHKGNTVCNALFIDGHAESRLLGGVTGRDICATAPSIFWTGPAQ